MAANKNTSIIMKNFFHIGPPFTLGPGFKRLLARFTNVPPFLSHWVGRHLLHVCFKILSFVFKITKQIPIFVEDGIIMNIALFNYFQNVRPNGRVQFFVFFEFLGSDFDNHAVADHSQYPFIIL